MDKRTLIAVVLSIVVLLGYQMFMGPKKMAETKAAKKAETEQKTEAKSAENSKDDKTIQQVKKPAAEKQPSGELKIMEIENGFLKLYFNEGTGDIRSAQVIKYKNKNIGIKHFKHAGSDYFRSATAIPANFSSNVTKSGDKTIVTFTGAYGDMAVTKRYEIDNNSYKVKLLVKIDNLSDRSQTFPLDVIVGPGIGEGFHEKDYIFQGPIMYDGKKVRDEKQDSVDEPIIYQNPKWVGYTSKYYLMAVASEDFKEGRFEKSGKDSAVIKGTNSLLINPKSGKQVELIVYTGPKEYNLLKDIGYKFTKSIEFGVFSFLAIPMLKFMLFIVGIVKNYGVAIIILTIVIKAVTFPLTQKSMTSMKRMQKLNPKMTELREKYKGDKEKLNKAMMELYKKEGVNPFGSCLPMFLQIPIFFALYKSLMVSIELTGSPFFGWITDLSMKDPYYITPVIMGASMFVQQKMTPATGDSTQQKIMLMMPIIFTFLFLNFPSGLVVYWLTNNLLTIAQQFYINKKTS